MEKCPLIVREFILFLTENKAYWVTPIVILCLLLMILAVFGGSQAYPLVYSLF